MREERINKKIKHTHLCELYEVVMCRIKLQRKNHTSAQRAGYDIRKPFAVALCQGAAMHYLGKPSIKKGVSYKGVKDFDVWLFYQKNEVNFRFYRAKLVDKYSSQEFGERKVDILMRAIEYTSNPRVSIQNWLETSNNSSPGFLSKKAVILIFPREHLGMPIWCEGTAC